MKLRVCRLLGLSQHHYIKPKLSQNATVSSDESGFSIHCPTLLAKEAMEEMIKFRLGATLTLQIGQVVPTLSHPSIQWTWKQWRHLSHRSFSPLETLLRHTTQYSTPWLFPVLPNQLLYTCRQLTTSKAVKTKITDSICFKYKPICFNGVVLKLKIWKDWIKFYGCVSWTGI